MDSPLNQNAEHSQTSAATTKKTYRTPTLTDYGTVEQVTQTGTGAPIGDGVGLSS